jgi:hypothetical protein
MNTNETIEAICDVLDCNHKSTVTSLRFGDFNEDADFTVCGVFHHPIKNKWFVRVFEASFEPIHDTREAALAFLALRCGVGDNAAEKEDKAHHEG